MKEIEDGSVQFKDEENGVAFVYRKPKESKMVTESWMTESWKIELKSVKALTKTDDFKKADGLSN